jgi:4-amino-4-deoxy-L-arabinose transferase-like glycosyltransferase
MIEARRARWVLLLAVLAAILFQGTRGLYSPDEGRYTAVALEMLKSGDWLHPRLNDDTPHWTKPPLTYWAIAASVAFAGWNEWAVRLPNLLAFLATLALLAQIGRVLLPTRHWLPPLIYASTLLPLLAANIVSTDTLLAALVAGYTWAFIEIRQLAPHVAALRLALWALAALAFMTKGPPALLPLLGLAIAAFFERRERPLAAYVSVPALALFALIGLSWFAIVISAEPKLLRYFLIDETLRRVATGAHHRNGEWYGALKVYLPTIVIGTLPWGLVLAWARWRRPAELAPSGTDARFLTHAIGWPLVVFVLAGSRLPLYLLPLMVPLATLMALRWPERWLERAAPLALAGLLLAVGLRGGAAYVGHPLDDRALGQALAETLPPLTDEIVFVDTPGRFGVRLYLPELIVERANSGRDETPNVNAEPLAQALGDPARCRVLLMRAESAPLLLAETRALGHDFAALSNLGRYVSATDRSGCADAARISQTQTKTAREPAPSG